MSPLLIFGIILLSIFIFTTILSIHGRLKMKQEVKRNWGKQPHQVRFDKEESLKAAWQTSKTFQTWDSEIDDLTWADLDLFTIFDLINATYSSVGSEALYQQLRNYQFTPQPELEALIHFFQTNPQKREQLQYYFALLGKKDHNFTKQYLKDGKHQQLGNFSLYLFLGVLPLVGLCFLLLGNGFGLLLMICSALFNTIFYLTKKNQLETELTSMSYLVQTISLSKKIAQVDTPLQNQIKDVFQPLKAIPFVGFSFQIKNQSEAEMFFDYINMLFMIPFISYHLVLAKITNHRQDAIKLWNLLGQLEVAMAILNFRTYMPLTCQPTFTKGGVSATDIYHPLVKNAVSNPVTWQQNTLVTGSNASGKSTYVKSIAIGCILAQTIQTVPATTFTLQAGHVLTSMAIEDDLFAGDSYFVAEIKSLKRLLTQVQTQERCYCFVDEILKGTNTIERIAASASVVSWLTTYPSLAFVATHDIELTEMLKNKCTNLHFEEQVTPQQGITFDYSVKEGPATTRNAIALLQVLQYPEPIVTTAQKTAVNFDQQRTWPLL
ncbi:MAG: MutS-related protein [Enterococcus sp.]